MLSQNIMACSSASPTFASAMNVTVPSKGRKTDHPETTHPLKCKKVYQDEFSKSCRIWGTKITKKKCDILEKKYNFLQKCSKIWLDAFFHIFTDGGGPFVEVRFI